MNKIGFLKVSITLLFAGLSVSGQVINPDGVRFVPNVVQQVRALTDRPERLGLRIGTSPDPSLCKHYQAITRVDGPDGTPFLMMTRSGNKPAWVPCDDSPGELDYGNLIMFRMGSRDKHGERMRSNLLQKGVQTDSTVAPTSDEASIYFTTTEDGLVFRDGSGSRPAKVYQHPGGMQLAGNVLAVALETPLYCPGGLVNACGPGGSPAECEACIAYPRASTPTLIQFYNVSSPEAPTLVDSFVPRDNAGEPLEGAGVLGVTPMPDGTNLMFVTFGDNEFWYWYRSSPGSLQEDLDWELYDVEYGKKSSQDKNHQTLHLIREGDMNGDLYLVGASGDQLDVVFGFDDQERIDAYKVNFCTAGPAVCGSTKIYTTTVVNSRRIVPFANSGSYGMLMSLAAASGFHITPSGELLFYAAEHDNDGPSGNVRAGEWRHRDVVRPGSPTLLPTADVEGPYEVDEGSSITLTGTASPPITKAFLQFFHGEDFTSFNPIVDFDDRNKDDFDNLALYEMQTLAGPPPTFVSFFQHHDKARSWNWFAPPGCSIVATDLNNGNVDEVKTLTMLPTDPVEIRSDARLSEVMHDGGTDDIDRELDQVEFGADCSTFYNSPFRLFWDLDRDGTYETEGTSVQFSTAVIDGPSSLSIPVKAAVNLNSHSGTAQAGITVRNVAPSITTSAVRNTLGKVIGTETPFVLTGQPVTLSAVFTDPGRLDTQTAQIAWGDGSVNVQNEFSAFQDAFGTGSGSLSHSHTFVNPGDYTVTFSVTDDDGGTTGTQSANVKVLTPEQATQAVIGILTDLIAGTPDGDEKRALEHALRALAGSRPMSINGALNKIREGNRSAAVAFLQQAERWLQAARAVGSDTELLEELVVQIAAALA